MKSRGARGAAYSLIEVIVAVALLLVGLAVLNSTFTLLKTSRAHVQGDAEQLAESLRSLRQQAITQGRPVGIGIPTEAGTRGAANGYYILEGEIRPKVVRRVMLGDTRSIQMSACHWPELPFSATPSETFVDSSYQLSDWETPFPQDSLLMFLPSGEMLTNLPTFQGQAALVLAYGIQTRRGPLPGFELERAQGAMTIWCSILGEVRLESGLAQASGRVGTVASSGALAEPPPRTSADNRNPSFAGPMLEVSPPPNSNTLAFVAPGSGSTLRVNRYVSLKVTAQDPDGDPLWCTWASGGEGTFTKRDSVKMRYDPQLKLWVATWAWHAPPGVAPNQEFQLDATVTDGRGGSARLSAAMATGGRLHILNPGRLAFTRGNDTWMSNWDGSDPVIVRKDRTLPRWSRGAGRIVVRETAPGGNLYVVTPDGRSEEPLTARAIVDWRSSGTWAENNSRVGFAEQVGTLCSVHTVSPWGVNNELEDWGSVTYPIGSQPKVDYHPEDPTILLSSSQAGPMYLVTESGATELPAAVGAEASFSSNGQNIIYRDALNRIVIAPTSDPANIGPSIGLPGNRAPRLSNDSNHVVVEAMDGAQPNCYLLQGTLTRPLKLFDFSEPCRHPDWGQ